MEPKKDNIINLLNVIFAWVFNFEFILKFYALDIS